MIINPNHNNMTPQDNPPSYDLVTEGDLDHNTPEASNAKQLQGSKPPLVQTPPYPVTGPSYTTQPLYTPAPVVFHYTNPRTHEQVASLLPPDHPEMVCLQAGQHVAETRFGMLGILAAVFWFPLGIGLCLLDRRVRCTRCGHHIDDGLCG